MALTRSSTERVETPFLSAFAVREVSSMDPKHLRRMIQRHDVGTLEVKVRGVDVAPESLRARLKPRRRSGRNTLSSALAHGSSVASWNTMPMPPGSGGRPARTSPFSSPTVWSS